jgi:leucine dehydrogenase
MVGVRPAHPRGEVTGEFLGGAEEVVLCHDRVTDLEAIIVVDDTTCGPGLGGVRWRHYPTQEAAVAEAERLARVMTLKNALAELPFGGAKSVLLAPPGGPPQGPVRQAQLRSFARFVARLGGAYLPGVDMGTSVEDLAHLATMADVSCHRHDPSPATAAGVAAGLRAALEARGRRLAGSTVVVQGAGHVGADLARRLARGGAHVLVADVDRGRAAAVAEAVGGSVVPIERALWTPCDVLAPCGPARVVSVRTVDDLACDVIAGAANDVLDERAMAWSLAARDVLYVPDFLLNAGGVIDIHARRAGSSPEAREAAVARIGTRVGEILARAAATGLPPLVAAEDRASARLGRPVQIPD